MWGKGGKGQLGTGDLIPSVIPTAVDLQDDIISDVICGPNATFIITGM